MKDKNRLRHGLGFGVIMGICSILLNLAFDHPQTTGQIWKAIIGGIVQGIISGFLFGWLIGVFSRSKFVNKTTAIETKPGEQISFETSANHFKGIEGVGGKLYLTSQRLVFKSHKLNIQNHELSIDLGDMVKVERYKPLGLVDNGLSITTREGRVEKFVVKEAEQWMKLLSPSVLKVAHK